MTCSSKSQRASSPESSSTRRSCTSPHAPRIVDALSAVARVAVSERSDSVDRLTSVRRSPSWPNCSDRSALERPDLPLDAADGVAQGSEQGGGRVVDVAGGLEVGHPVAQDVTLGLGPRGAGEQGRAGRQPREQAADECADDEPDEQSGEVHASTVPDAADTTRPRHPVAGDTGRHDRRGPTAYARAWLRVGRVC